ncbi:MAG TPA: MFS transporter [Jatrophihabitans sp.]|nr:MFS transporter [Jatrophihabitans sp.]
MGSLVAGDGQADGHPWRALAVCLVGGGMVLLDVSIVNVALPSIRQGLGAPQSALQWVLSGYALAFGLALVPAGRLGDAFGRRRLFVLGLALFTVCSVLCGSAQSASWLALARVAQGLSGGTLTPQITAVIQQLFQGKDRGKAFGLYGSVIGLSTAVGPLLGGSLIQLFGQQSGWRWVFFVNLPVGVVLLPLALRLLPGRDPDSRREREQLDPVGVIMLGLGLVVFLLPLVEEQQWSGRGKWLLIPLALAILAGFIGWEFRYARTKYSLIPLMLLAKRSYAFGLGIALLYFAGFTPLFFVFTLYLQLGLHYSPLLAGLATIPFALGGAATASLAGRSALRFGRPLVAAGLFLVCVALLVTRWASSVAPDNHTGWVTAIPLLLGGVGGGMVISPNQTLTLSEVPERRAGSAGGLLQTAQRVGAAVGIAAVGSVFFAQLGTTIQRSASQGGRGGPAAALPYALAFQHAIVVAAAFVALALVLAVVDIMVDRGRRGEDRAAQDTREAGSGAQRQQARAR